ncbi:hypothetical protein I302_105157 [Kwoniella bestiolae CBS 10118]|uniref:Uncharacterized protein n=1 Tax=Kwoniella bestiolae CBS 10118 TaxID=1296100 RepID=A0A1B9FSB9_9TREE|nr:hypothetical protein I302_08445 [Kwoniella bestiolae CBS 10118]OCF21668.1 hypothetical protein I302_08445 [Kwoniella bestiolae CBS 10118]
MSFNSSSSLWYTRPAQLWQEALPVGNGRLGAMIFGGTKKERLQLNEDTLWGAQPYSPTDVNDGSSLKTLPNIQRKIFEGDMTDATELARTHFMGRPASQASYQTLGDLYIEMASLDAFGFDQYHRELNIDTSVASVSFRAYGVTYHRQIVASHEHQVIAVHLTADQQGKLDINISAGSTHSQSSLTVEDNGTVFVLAGQNEHELNLSGDLHFRAKILVKTTNGSIRDCSDHIQVRQADQVTLYIAMATNFRQFDDITGNPDLVSTEQLSLVKSIKFEDLQQEAIASYQAIYKRVTLELKGSHQSNLPTDQRLAAFRQGGEDANLASLYFNYGRYLLISSSRPGSQPANLQGIWNDSNAPPWGSKYTININTEMNYWPAEVTNMPELVQPLIQMVQELAETGSQTAKVMYGAKGWVCHHNTDLWRASAPIDLPQYGLWPSGGAWLCKHLWDHFDYAQDIEYLKTIYPILAGACDFFLDTLLLDPHSGFMVTNPSMSPENAHHQDGNALCAGPSMDNQILRDLFSNTIAASELLSEDERFRASLIEKRNALRPIEIGSGGQVKEWQEDWDSLAADPQHRHTSHLYGLYPSNQIRVKDRPDLAQACKVTLENRGEGVTGWATAWRLSLWARLRDPERAYAMLCNLLSASLCYSNLFDTHPPLDDSGVTVFQIDGNFGGTAGIVEMIVQDYRDEVDLLPALPLEWSNGKLSGICLRGGWTVDVEWKDSTLYQVVLNAKIAAKKLITYRDAEYLVSLAPGETVRLYGRNLNREESS